MSNSTSIPNSLYNFKMKSSPNLQVIINEIESEKIKHNNIIKNSALSNKDVIVEIKNIEDRPVTATVTESSNLVFNPDIPDNFFHSISINDDKEKSVDQSIEFHRSERKHKSLQMNRDQIIVLTQSNTGNLNMNTNRYLINLKNELNNAEEEEYNNMQSLKKKRKTFNNRKASSNLDPSFYGSLYNTCIKLPHVTHIEEFISKREGKVEYCDICFQDIKDKFTLACGDFFCRECITQHIENCLNNVTLFRNLRCPKSICNEKIKKSVLEKILPEKEYGKFVKIKQKIDGLYNPMNFPCPIPDCDSYGVISNICNGNLECLNFHSFCIKCLKESHKKGNCVIEQNETEEMLNSDKLIKKCPNCRSWVEKQPKGCNNVTCANIWCSMAFCWICMRTAEKNHYSYPLSTCFGMQEVSDGSRFAQHKCLRITKCMLIFLLMIIILPVLILLFSFVVITFYILAFVLDGSAVKNLKLKTERRQKIFRFLIYSTYIAISLPSIPLGYWTLCSLVLSSPFIYIYKKIKNCIKKNQETE